MQPIGAHMSIAGGLDLAFSRAAKIGCTAVQIFTKNANRWQGKPISEAAACSFRAAWRQSGIAPVIAHDSYLINLAAPEKEKWQKSILALVGEMERCSLLGIPWLVIHPGAHVGSGEASGLQRIGAALRIVFDQAPSQVGILLENTAGSGTMLGARFAHLAEIMNQVPAGRFGVCLDTCHAFAADYDLSTAAGYDATMGELQNEIGCEKVMAFHLNDSKKGIGCRVDRHEHIGQGAIGEEGFRLLMRDDRFSAIPKILETPKGEDDGFDFMNLATLRRLAGEEEA